MKFQFIGPFIQVTAENETDNKKLAMLATMVVEQTRVKRQYRKRAPKDTEIKATLEALPVGGEVKLSREEYPYKMRPTTFVNQRFGSGKFKTRKVWGGYRFTRIAQ